MKYISDMEDVKTAITEHIESIDWDLKSVVSKEIRVEYLKAKSEALKSLVQAVKK